jgi:hypothetical protein
MKRVMWLLLLVGGLMATAIAGLSQDEKKREPAPPAVRTECPHGECCLWRLGLVTGGKLEHKLEKPHDCPTGEIAQGAGTLELKPLKSAGLPCDEKHMLIPDGSQLSAKIHTIHRKDDLAHICGTFTITFEEKVIFEGDIELMHRVNTHWGLFGTDPCDRKEHLQGWLRGKGADTGRAKGYLVRAMLVARTDPRDGGAAGYAIGETHVNGVIIRCKQ